MLASPGEYQMPAIFTLAMVAGREQWPSIANELSYTVEATREVESKFGRRKLEHVARTPQQRRHPLWHLADQR